MWAVSPRRGRGECREDLLLAPSSSTSASLVWFKVRSIKQPKTIQVFPSPALLARTPPHIPRRLKQVTISYDVQYCCGVSLTSLEGILMDRFFGSLCFLGLFCCCWLFSVFFFFFGFC